MPMPMRAVSQVYFTTTYCTAWHPKKDCRDLLRCMLQADPVTRASLDEVLNHPWMHLPTFWRPSMSLVGTDVPKHAALKWPDQVDRKRFDRIAARESKNGDDAWRSLADALELVSRLCGPCSGDDSRAHTPRLASHMSRLSRGARGLPDRTLALLAKFRSRAVQDWSILVSPLRMRQTKIETSGSRPQWCTQFLRYMSGDKVRAWKCDVNDHSMFTEFTEKFTVIENMLSLLRYRHKEPSPFKTTSRQFPVLLFVQLHYQHRSFYRRVSLSVTW